MLAYAGGDRESGKTCSVVENDQHCVLIQQVGGLAVMTYNLLLGLFCTLGLTSDSSYKCMLLQQKYYLKTRGVYSRKSLASMIQIVRFSYSYLSKLVF